MTKEEQFKMMLKTFREKENVSEKIKAWLFHILDTAFIKKRLYFLTIIQYN